MKTNNIISSALLLTLLSLVSPATAHAATYYVAWWGNNRNPGTLQSPFDSIYRAFNTAADSGDTIVLHDGTYSRFAATTHGKSITLVSLNGPTNCILDFLDGDTLYLNLEGGNPVTTISGFTFRNSKANCLRMNGGCTVTISNCIFTANHDLAAVSIEASTSSTFIRNCVFTGNSASFGGVRPVGGAITATGTGRLEVSKCQFSGNSVSGFGGAGGAIWSDLNLTILSTCVFVANRASSGGAVRAGRALVYNCTFAANDGTGRAIRTNGDLEIRNSILWDGGEYELLADAGAIAVNRSDIQGGYPGTVNIDADPKFVRDPGTLEPSDFGDLHLQITSPCRNSGVTSATDRDLDETPRPMESGYDIGAYEFRDGPLGYWYVDAARGNDADSNSGTSTSPLATVTKAVTHAVNGNRIYVKPGNYGSDRPRITKALQLINWGDTGLARIGQP